MLNKAYRFRAYPDDQQADLLNQTFGCVRFVWNLMLHDLKVSYEKTKKFTYPTPAYYKEAYPFLSDVDSMALCNVQMNLKQSLARFLKDRKLPKKRKTRFPKFKSKHKTKKSYTTNPTGAGQQVRIECGKLRLPKVGLLDVVLYRRVEGKVKSATITQEPTGKYFVSILTEQADPILDEINPTNVVGLDFSFHDLIVTNEGAKAKHLEWIRSQEKKLSRAQRILSRRKIGSRGYEKQKIKVALIHEKTRNKRNNLLRLICCKLFKRYDVVVVEDIDLVSMMKRGKRRRYGKSIGRLGFGELRTMLKTCAERQGKLFIKVSRWFPSSQLCSCCGYRNKNTKDLSIRQWTCPECGAQHDRDQTAAQNLVNLYLFCKSTGATPGSYAEGEVASAFSLWVKRKHLRRTRKNMRLDLTSPLL
jgi:putative transposase